MNSKLETRDPGGASGKGQVVIVDDDIALAKAIQITLADDGYEVTVAHDGPTGLECIRRIEPEVVLLDLKLPGMSGEQVLAQLHESTDPIASLVVIIISATPDAHQIVKMLDHGAVDYIIKPFDMDVLVARVSTALGAKRRRDELQWREERIETIKREIEDAFDSFRDAIALIDRDFKIQRANRAALRMFGKKTYADVLGVSCYQAFYGRDTICPSCPAIQAFHTGVYAESEMTYQAANGDSRYHRVAAIPSSRIGHPLDVESGAATAGGPSPAGSAAAGGEDVRRKVRDSSVVTFLEVTEDITEVRRLREEHIHGQKVEAVAHLAGAFSHEINQPLGAIRGRAQLMLMNLDKEDQGEVETFRRDLQEVLGAVERIDQIVKKLHGITDYVTKPYAGETKILDIDRSSSL